MDVPFLADLPLDPKLRETGDDGTPLVEKDPESRSAVTSMKLAEKVHASLEGESASKPS